MKLLAGSSFLKLSPEASRWFSKVSFWSPKLLQMVIEGVMHVSKGFQVNPKVNDKLFGVSRWSDCLFSLVVKVLSGWPTLLPVVGDWTCEEKEAKTNA